MSAPVVVQGAAKSQNLSGLAFPSSVTKGNLLVAVVGQGFTGTGSAGGGSSVTDSLGNVWFQLNINITGNGTDTATVALACITTASGACTVTVNRPNTAFAIALMEISGAGLVLDGVPVGQSAVASPGTLTTAANNSIVIVGLSDDRDSTSTSWNIPAGWTAFQDTGNAFLGNTNAIGIAAMVQASAGAVSPTFTGTNITTNYQIIAAFQAVPAPAPTPIPNGNSSQVSNSTDLIVPIKTPMYVGPNNQSADGGTLSRTWALFFAQLAAGGGDLFRIETPAGAMNSSNTVFVLSRTVAGAPTPWLLLFLNGVYQEPTSDFTLASDQMTITMTVAPKSSDYYIFALYLTVP